MSSAMIKTMFGFSAATVAETIRPQKRIMEKQKPGIFIETSAGVKKITYKQKPYGIRFW